MIISVSELIFCIIREHHIGNQIIQKSKVKRFKIAHDDYLVIFMTKALQATLDHMISIQVLDESKKPWFKGRYNQCNLLPCFESLNQLLYHASADRKKRHVNVDKTKKKVI